MKISTPAAVGIIVVVLAIVGYFAWRTFQPSLTMTPEQQIAAESKMGSGAAPKPGGAAPAGTSSQ